MPAVTLADQDVTIPGRVVDLDSFREWATSEDFPKRGNIWWLQGEVWADMSRVEIFLHSQVKMKVLTALARIVDKKEIGIMFSGGFLSNAEGDFAGEPDLTFLSHDAIESKRIVFLDDKNGGTLEMQGSPDMVLEVVSPSSVKKDKIDLLKAYFEAGILEYWLVDVRKGEIDFEIYRRSPKGFVTTKKIGGWIPSAVFGKSFRLVSGKIIAEQPTFQLKVR